ncbi:MAG TPA: type IV pili methyl-accepting chemotaxis transducer N-terminal domain-containing protein [Rubrivivax sp.]|nr:type IV pili methyl-accepting chemotaxis transducer N-terminal domain-containing protein [Rubrivivax sp.]
MPVRTHGAALAAGVAALFAALAAPAAAPPPAGASAAGLPVAPAPVAVLNVAGRQRMLIQRACKAYLMLGQQIAPPRARAMLDDSIARFEAQLLELSRLAPSADARAALGKLQLSWREYRAVLTAPPSVAGAQELYLLGEPAQEAAHRLTLAVERAAPTPADRLVNVAGRQRMLAQRMAKYALFIAWGVQPHAARMELNLARSEFSTTMYQLATGLRNDAIGVQLERLDAQWQAYRPLFDRPLTPAMLADIAERSERMLDAGETLVSLYERLALAMPAAARASGAASGSSGAR